MDYLRNCIECIQLKLICEKIETVVLNVLSKEQNTQRIDKTYSHTYPLHFFAEPTKPQYIYK